MRLGPTLGRLGIFFAFAVVALGPAVAQEEEAERVILDQRPGEGERCIVCKQEIHGADVVEVRYKGRRFFVKAEMLDDFDAATGTSDEPLRALLGDLEVAFSEKAEKTVRRRIFRRIHEILVRTP